MILDVERLLGVPADEARAALVETPADVRAGHASRETAGEVADLVRVRVAAEALLQREGLA